MALPAHRAEAFKKYTLPSTKKGLRSFLGAVSFYRRYIKMLASQTAILSPLTSKLAPAKVVWTGEGELAFRSILRMICDTCVLCIPLPEDVYSIVTHASGLGIGGFCRSDGMENGNRRRSSRGNSAELSSATQPQRQKHWLLLKA